MRTRSRSHRVVAFAATLLVIGCDALPRDPEGTLARVRGGTLRVGVVGHPPLVVVGEGEAPRGPEARLVAALAGELDATVEWTPAPADEVAELVETFGLDLAIGGWERRSPLAKGLGTTRPFRGQGRRGLAWLTPPGENRWLLHVDRFLVAHRDDAERWLREAAGEASP